MSLMQIFCPHACLLTYLLLIYIITYLLTCLLIYIITCLLACLLPCLSFSLFSSLPTCLFDCLLAYLGCLHAAPGNASKAKRIPPMASTKASETESDNCACSICSSSRRLQTRKTFASGRSSKALRMPSEGC